MDLVGVNWVILLQANLQNWVDEHVNEKGWKNFKTLRMEAYVSDLISL